MGLGILAVAVGAYVVARETSIFAVHRIDVRGGSAAVDAQVQTALAPLIGKSLVGLDGGAAMRTVDSLPTVVSATYDRAFPNTLRITVVPEEPVAVLRSGKSAWLVSARGRVMETVSAKAHAGLPRLWLPAKAGATSGVFLPGAAGGAVARALGSAGAFRSRVASASLTGGVLVFHLRSGIELLLGPPNSIRLKVAVAAQALLALPGGSRYLDVTVPGRPVAGVTLPRTSLPKTSSRG